MGNELVDLKNIELHKKGFKVIKLSREDAATLKSRFKQSTFYKHALSDCYNNSPYKELISFSLIQAVSKTQIGLLEVYPSVSTNTLWINTIAIDSNFLRTGHGSNLLNTVLRYMKENYDYSQILLACDLSNTIGLSFWKKNGFTNNQSMNLSLNKPNINIMKKS